MNIEELKNRPWKEKGANIEDYFNYGLTEEQWSEYAKKIKQRFPELSSNIKKNKVLLSSEKDVLTYLFNFPCDYGGLGDAYGEEYENLNLFDNKTNLNKLVPIEKGERVFIQLEQPNVNLNNVNILPNNPINSSDFFNYINNQSFTNSFLLPNYFPNPFNPSDNFLTRYVYYIMYYYLYSILLQTFILIFYLY